jgi:hypothetical protein
LDTPFPPDYGGAIDMYYRIEALHSLGYHLTLHVFEYGRGRHKDLDVFGKVYYYQRKRSVLQLFSKLPFIVQSRKNKLLLKRLLLDDYPILFEGLHTSIYLEHPKIQQRITLVRMHNIEHEYYEGLSKKSKGIKKLFFFLEARKLKNYQSILSQCRAVLAIKESDASYFRSIQTNVHILPPAIPHIKGSYRPTKRYALFHGNLSVPENSEAVFYLVNTLAKYLSTSFHLIIAGKNPSKKIIHLCVKKYISIVANPTDEQLTQLIQEAHIHVLHTNNSSGVKLKLLSCLSSSGHLLVNQAMVEGTDLASLCVIAKDNKAFKTHFLGLQNFPLRKEDFIKRSKFLSEKYNNRTNSEQIIKLIEQGKTNKNT